MSYKAINKIQQDMEVEYLKTLSYEKINSLLRKQHNIIQTLEAKMAQSESPNELTGYTPSMAMKLTPVTEIDQIKEGDALAIYDGKTVITVKAQMVKVSEHDGTEVIYNRKKNHFFNVGMYLDGKSYVKEVAIVGV